MSSGTRAHPVTGGAVAPTVVQQRSRFASWLPDLAMLVAAIVFVRIGPGATLGYAVIAFGALLMVRQLAVRDLARRQGVAVIGILTLFVAIPVNRLPSSGTFLLTLCIVGFAIAASAIVGSRLRVPRGTLLVALLLVVLTFVTVVSPDNAAFLRELPLIVTSLPLLIIAGQAGGAVRTRITRFVVFTAVVQSVLGLVEPFLFAGHLWATAQLDSAGNKVPLINPLLAGGIERSQGTMGHPLALSFLLLLGLALVMRGIPALRTPTIVIVILILLAGLLASGSRNSLIIGALLLLYFLPRRSSLLRIIASTLIALFVLGLAIAGSWLSEASQRQFSDSGSITHRVGALDSVGKLMADQAVIHTLFGNGFSSTARLFSLGLLQTDGFNVIDNQFISSVATSGIIGFALLATISLLAIVRSSPRFRPAVIAVVATMLIFDTFTFPAVSALSFVIFGFGLHPREDASPLDQARKSERQTLLAQNPGGVHG